MIAALLLAGAVAIPPVPSDYVTDNAHVLSATTAGAIRQELQTYHDTTGNRVLVYIDQTTGDVPLEDWTIRAAEKWKLGSKAKDNGAVLFAFMQDHKVRIEVGYGLEGSLPDADASRIIQETILPKMRAGDVDGAIQAGVDRMLLTITPSFKDKIGHDAQQPAVSQDDGTSNAIAFLIIFLIFGGMFALFILSLFNKRMRSVWYWGAGSGGGWSSGGWSSGGGGFSGGGFSGGGGFGGGGASGGW